MSFSRSIAVIFGTRPEVVKVAPVIRALEAAGHRPVSLFTGQHADLAPHLMREAGVLPARRFDLPAGLPVDRQLAMMIPRLSDCFARSPPDAVMVQGDTVSAFAGALAAFYAGVPLFHIEAGLRTGDPAEPYPEETHRRLIAGMATLHFAPTVHAAACLMREGVSQADIHVTGNSGIDALLRTRTLLLHDEKLQAALSRRFPSLDPVRPLLLATLHRRENLGERAEAVADALATLARRGDLQIILPLHPNPAFANMFRDRLGGLAGVHLADPLSHTEIMFLLSRCRLLLTDSGGLQEEAPAFGVRTLILRRATERPEAVEAGISELVPLSETAIVERVCNAMALPPPPPQFPFGDGHAARRIVEAVDRWFASRSITSVQFAAA